MADDSSRASTTVAFTLPIACSVCLGKVKQPVLCPNNHVFCRSCMEVWLQRNKQCPACRVDITQTNPCKPIFGGMAYSERNDNFSNPELRKARFDLLFKEYEEELGRLENKIKAYKKQNKELTSKLEGKVMGGGDPCELSPGYAKLKQANGDVEISDVKKKLKESMAIQEQSRKDIAKLKQENSQLKDANVDLTHENQRLRVEIANRSPQRYGRYTMAALQTKVENYERENKKLQRALECSDKYTEQLQEENEMLREGKALEPKLNNDEKARKVTGLNEPSPEQKATDCESPSNLSGVKRKLNMDVGRQVNGDQILSSPSKRINVSFDLERPSPSTPTPHFNRMSLEVTPPKKLSSQKPVETISRYVNGMGKGHTNNKVNNASSGRVSADLSCNDGEAATDFVNNKKMLVHNDTGNLDITVTEEMNDCLKLFKQAEKNISSQKEKVSSFGDAASTSKSPSTTAEKTPSSDACFFKNSLKSQSFGQSLPTMTEHMRKQISSEEYRSEKESSFEKNGSLGTLPQFDASEEYQRKPSSSYDTATLPELNDSLLESSSQEFEQCLQFLDKAKGKVAARKESMFYLESMVKANDQSQPTFDRFARNETRLTGHSEIKRPLSAFDPQSTFNVKPEHLSRPSSAPGLSFQHPTPSSLCAPKHFDILAKYSNKIEKPTTVALAPTPMYPTGSAQSLNNHPSGMSVLQSWRTPGSVSNINVIEPTSSSSSSSQGSLISTLPQSSNQVERPVASLHTNSAMGYGQQRMKPMSFYSSKYKPTDHKTTFPKPR